MRFDDQMLIQRFLSYLALRLVPPFFSDDDPQSLTSPLWKCYDSSKNMSVKNMSMNHLTISVEKGMWKDVLRK